MSEILLSALKTNMMQQKNKYEVWRGGVKDLLWYTEISHLLKVTRSPSLLLLKLAINMLFTQLQTQELQHFLNTMLNQI